MAHKIELDTAQYVGLLERLIELNKEKPEIFLKENLIPAVQNAKIYEENIEKSLPYCNRTSFTTMENVYNCIIAERI